MTPAPCARWPGSIWVGCQKRQKTKKSRGWDRFQGWGKTGIEDRFSLSAFFSILAKSAPSPPTNTAAPNRAIEKKYPRQIGLHSAQRL